MTGVRSQIIFISSFSQRERRSVTICDSVSDNRYHITQILYCENDRTISRIHGDKPERKRERTDMTVSTQERNAIVTEVKGLIEHKMLRAASRNSEVELQEKPNDYDEKIESLSESYDVFEGKYVDTISHYVFLMDGSVVEIGNKKYHNPVITLFSKRKRRTSEMTDMRR